VLRARRQRQVISRFDLLVAIIHANVAPVQQLADTIHVPGIDRIEQHTHVRRVRVGLHGSTQASSSAPPWPTPSSHLKPAQLRQLVIFEMVHVSQ
jgi:hypothetical protein